MGSLRNDFSNPPRAWNPRPLWFWNAPPARSETEAIMEGGASSGYQGFGILPTEAMKLEFMSPAYLDRYEEAVEKAASLGMKMCLYDEFWFPSGGAGGQLAARFPGALGKRLDLLEVDAAGPRSVSLDAPPGVTMAVVALREDTFERVDLTGRLRDGHLTWDAPAGPWKVMWFTCVTDGARGLVDTLDPDAVRRFLSLTYEPYYERLRRHFGRTIDSAFYDEPTFHWIEGGRAWTPSFNERFRKAHGFDPAPLYPALWRDIGPDTSAARNALFGFRARLFAEGFVKTIADWCAARGIELTGHVDQEEVANPVGLCGDLIACFRHQPIPGIDQIFAYGRASKAYKIVSSAAANYDRRRVMTECYGAMPDMPVSRLYREAMDQFAKGINVMVPHAVWYDPKTIVFPPELSHRTPPYAEELPAYNRYAGRLQRILQHGHPVAEIAVLYPIAGLQAAYRFGAGVPYEGGVIPPEADYMDVGERLSLELRRDFTFLHPDTLDERCRIEGRSIRLRHPRWSQRYAAVIVPGGTTIRASNLRKIKAFFDRGGTVIFTTRLPDTSAEIGRNAEVRETIAAIFGEEPRRSAEAKDSDRSEKAEIRSRENRRGGKAWFLPDPTAAALEAVLSAAIPTPDIGWEAPPRVRGGNLSAFHKRIGGADFHFFANSSDDPVDTVVRLRAARNPEVWDPHTGRIAAAEVLPPAGEPSALRVRLVLPPVHSVFIVSPGASSGR